MAAEAGSPPLPRGQSALPAPPPPREKGPPRDGDRGAFPFCRSRPCGWSQLWSFRASFFGGRKTIIRKTFFPQWLLLRTPVEGTGLTWPPWTHRGQNPRAGLNPPRGRKIRLQRPRCTPQIPQPRKHRQFLRPVRRRKGRNMNAGVGLTLQPTPQAQWVTGWHRSRARRLHRTAGQAHLLNLSWETTDLQNILFRPPSQSPSPLHLRKKNKPSWQLSTRTPCRDTRFPRRLRLHPPL